MIWGTPCWLAYFLLGVRDFGAFGTKGWAPVARGVERWVLKREVRNGQVLPTGLGGGLCSWRWGIGKGSIFVGGERTPIFGVGSASRFCRRGYRGRVRF